MKQVVYPADLEMIFRDRIREVSTYKRLYDLVVASDKNQQCGWSVQIEGRFSAEDLLWLADLTEKMRMRFQLDSLPDPILAARRYTYPNCGETASDMTANMVPIGLTQITQS